MPQIVPTTTPGQDTASTSNGILAAQRVVDMDDTIHLLEPDAAPLTVLMRKMGSGTPAMNPEFNWLEDALLQKTLTVVTAMASGDTSLYTNGGVVAADLAILAIGDIILVPSTGEHLRVTAVGTTTNTVIVRAFGSTSAAAIPANEVCWVIGNAQAEGADLTTILATNLTKKTNYTQIFRTPFGATRTLANSELYGGKYLTYQQKKAGIEHQIALEKSAIFGEPKEVLTGNSPVRSSGGIDYFISTNEIGINGALSYSALVAAMQQIFRYGSQSARFCLSAPIVCTALDILVYNRQGTIQSQDSNVAGVKIKRIQSSHGDLMVAKSNLLTNVSAFNDRMYVLDMDTLERRPFTGATTKLLMNRQGNGIDGQIHEYITEMGWQMNNEQASGVLTGITSAA